MQWKISKVLFQILFSMSHDKNIMNIAISGQMYHGTFPCNLMVKKVMNKRTQTCSIDRRNKSLYYF
jgi:hypothetical protein